MESPEDASLLVNIRTLPQKNKEKVAKPQHKPALVMKNFIVGHIIMFPLILFYIAIFYTLFMMSFRKCHYKGLKVPLVCFMTCDFLLIIALIMNLVSMVKRMLKLFGNALTVVMASLLVRVVGTWWFWRDAQECFSEKTHIIKLCMFSLVFLGSFGFGLYYLYVRINRKPWKEIFMKE